MELENIIAAARGIKLEAERASNANLRRSRVSGYYGFKYKSKSIFWEAVIFTVLMLALGLLLHFYP